jgi:hypothetical protein
MPKSVLLFVPHDGLVRHSEAALVSLLANIQVFKILIEQEVWRQT